MTDSPPTTVSFVAIGQRDIPVVAGYLARRRGNEYSKYLLRGGGILVVLGVPGLLWFLLAFS